MDDAASQFDPFTRLEAASSRWEEIDLKEVLSLLHCRKSLIAITVALITALTMLYNSVSR